MSKSLGNVVAPQKVVEHARRRRAAPVGRVDRLPHEMSVSDEILKRVSDAYRRIRNTARFLLGNLDGFDPATHLLPLGECLLLDQWAVQQAWDVQQAVVAAYARYDFPEIVQRVQNFCTNEMGALYLDITKDRLYTMPSQSHGRRSAQSAMTRILEAMVRWLAPIASFTAEEIWQYMPGTRGESVLFETWYGDLAALQGSPAQRAFWADLLAVREVASKQLEIMRGNRELALRSKPRSRCISTRKPDASSRPTPTSCASSSSHQVWRSTTKANAPADAAPVDSLHEEGRFVSVSVRKSSDVKCIRCWQYRPDVGADPAHPEICARCVTNVEGRARLGGGSDDPAKMR